MHAGVFDGSLTPKSRSFPDLIEKLRRIAEEMKRISSEFHVIEK